ncbi:MAG: DUF6517 family protein [Halopenitus sp.]
MHTRRQLLGAIGATGVAATSGCLGVLTGEKAYEKTASPVRASDDASKQTGYELKGVQERTIEESFKVAGQKRTVKATNFIATYEKTLDHPVLGETKTGVFAAVSTPAFEIAGKTLSPVAEYSNKKLVGLIASKYEQLTINKEVRKKTRSTLGKSIDVSKFDATATFNGQEIDIYIHVGKLQHNEDFVIPVGIYPQQREGEEEPNIVTLIESLKHPAATPTES